MSQNKEQGKTKTKNKNTQKNPEKQLCKLKVRNLHVKDLGVMTVKMIQDLGKNLEAKFDKLQEVLNKEIEDVNIKQEEMQNTIAKIKILLEGTTDYRRQEND